MALCEWITASHNPLTARVFVNRLWKLFFGTGLSRVLDYIGSQGEWPSQPELLDWLAVEFIESGWDVRHVLKLMVNSAAYRQDSRVSQAKWTADPDNRLMSRGPRHRLEAEVLRDQALAVGGLPPPRGGGPGGRP